jgi:PAS domain S-box-containing protein
MDVNFQIAADKMKKEKLEAVTQEEALHLDVFILQIKNKSDRLINYFLPVYFIAGLIFAAYYDTWLVGIVTGIVSLVAYYSTKWLMPASNLYQYVLSAVFGIFMAQYIYQMHGLFEMHFVAFIGSAALITYQNWKIQIPLVIIVVLHHAIFGYLQFSGVDSIYFTQLDYMDLQTFIIHVLFAAIIFFICGLWAHHFKNYSLRHIEQTFLMGRLREEKAQEEKINTMSESMQTINEQLTEAQQLAHIGSWMWDIKNNKVHRSQEFYHIFDRTAEELNSNYESFLYCMFEEDRKDVQKVLSQCLNDHKPFSFEARVIIPNKPHKTIYAQGKAITDETGQITRLHGTIQDITSRKNYEEALEKSNTELRKSNLELDKFVYSVSHDLRAPLLSMQGLVDMTEEETAEILTRENMQMLKGSIQRLDSFIADILNYSRNARMEIKSTTVDFNKTLSDITNDLQYMNRDSKEVAIITTINQSCTFCTDNGRLMIILNNLISNAIRYCNPATADPFVKITVASDEKSALIEIEDNGIGIAKEFHQKIFDMFYRVSENSTGSGLGLYIVKETMTRLMGEISITSEPGKGTKFILRIPNLFYQ